MAKSSKGSAFEREVCVLLSKWWTDGRRDDIFWRTAGSGARATVRSKKGKQTHLQHGDVMATDPIGQPLIDLITIEIKRGYKEDSFQNLIDKSEYMSQQKYEGWIEKAINSSKLSGSAGWLLITRKDKRLTLVLMPKHLYTKLRQINKELYEPKTIFSFGFNLRKKSKDGKRTIKNGKVKMVRIKGMLLADFLNTFSRKDIEALV